MLHNGGSYSLSPGYFFQLAGILFTRGGIFLFQPAARLFLFAPPPNFFKNRPVFLQKRRNFSEIFPRPPFFKIMRAIFYNMQHSAYYAPIPSITRKILQIIQIFPPPAFHPLKIPRFLRFYSFPDKLCLLPPKIKKKPHSVRYAAFYAPPSPSYSRTCARISREF